VRVITLSSRDRTHNSVIGAAMTSIRLESVQRALVQGRAPKMARTRVGFRGGAAVVQVGGGQFRNLAGDTTGAVLHPQVDGAQDRRLKLTYSWQEDIGVPIKLIGQTRDETGNVEGNPVAYA